MTVRGYFRGHLAYYDDIANIWRYDDSDCPVDDMPERPCPQCHRQPTPEGYDACLGHIPGAISACCGHGVEPGYISWKPLEETEPTWEITIHHLAGIIATSLAAGIVIGLLYW